LNAEFWVIVEPIDQFIVSGNTIRHSGRRFSIDEETVPRMDKGILNTISSETHVRWNGSIGCIQLCCSIVYPLLKFRKQILCRGRKGHFLAKFRRNLFDCRSLRFGSGFQDFYGLLSGTRPQEFWQNFTSAVANTFLYSALRSASA